MNLMTNGIGSCRASSEAARSIGSSGITDSPFSMRSSTDWSEKPRPSDRSCIDRPAVSRASRRKRPASAIASSRSGSSWLSIAWDNQLSPNMAVSAAVFRARFTVPPATCPVSRPSASSSDSPSLRFLSVILCLAWIQLGNCADGGPKSDVAVLREIPRWVRSRPPGQAARGLRRAGSRRRSRVRSARRDRAPSARHWRASGRGATRR